MCIRIGSENKSVGSEHKSVGSEHKSVDSEHKSVGSEHKSVDLEHKTYAVLKSVAMPVPAVLQRRSKLRRSSALALRTISYRIWMKILLAINTTL
ncbi:MAG: hypothetical protein RM347_020470 [Nostoc sp. ChiQUE02]|nr:hypothetical protein [Nostoc sp. ChiQUE02]